MNNANLKDGILMPHLHKALTLPAIILNHSIFKRMTRVLLSLFIFFLPTIVCAQKVELKEKFRSDFINALDSNFSEKQLYKMLNDYWFCLYPGSDNIQVQDSINGYKHSYFNLHNFKNEKLYTDNIGFLINSKNAKQRTFAYMVISSAYDTTREEILLEKLSTERDTMGIAWAGIGLMNMKSKHTTELFDFLVKNEDFGDAHMLPMFIQLDKDSLQQTAYKRIDKKDVKSKILAAQILSVTLLNSKTDSLLRYAVQNWEMNSKGYAIYSVKELQMVNLLDILKPLLKDKKTSSISLEALANSPTEADRNYVFELVEQQDTVSVELLNSLYNSKNIDNIKYWLKLLYTKPIAKDEVLKEYFFSVFDHPLIRSDSVLQVLQIALQNIKDKNVLAELGRALEGRTDEKSVSIFVALLKHKSSTVRYWTAKTVENNTSKKLKNSEIKKLIKRGLEDGNTPDD